MSDEEDSILLRIQKHETKKSSENGEKTKPYIVYEISCEDGFSVQSHNIRGTNVYSNFTLILLLLSEIPKIRD